MAIKRNPLNDKEKPTGPAARPSARPKQKAEAFIRHAVDHAHEPAKGTETVYPWEESGEDIIHQKYFKIPLGYNRKFELFWRISREETP